MYDLVIRNGLLVDGSGGPTRHGDLGICGDRIVAVGDLDEGGRRQIDADGKIVTPGWVDIHTHYDGQVTWDPEVSPSGWHGVTTVVMGNCGVGFAPADPNRHDWLIQLMEGVEDIPGTALAEGMTWNWESFPDYLDEVASMPRVLDVAAQVPHGALRAYVMEDRSANDPATPGDIDLMAKLVREAVEAGAVGFSTTRTVLHRARDGELAAGTTAGADELIAIGAALGGAGRRVFMVATDFVLSSMDEEFAWMKQISRDNNIPLTYGVPQVDFAPEGWREMIERGVAANRDGAQLVPQVCGKPTCALIGLESSYHPFIGDPTYRAVRKLPLAERVAELSKPEVKAAILAEHGAAPDIGLFQVADFDKLFPFGDPPDYEPPADKSILAIATREGRDPIEVTYDLLLQRGGRELLYRPATNYSYGNFDVLHEMLTHPDTVLGLADGGAHCGFITDAAMPTLMLLHWVRDRTRGPRFDLPFAVHQQTRRTAELYGFLDRGLLAPGYLADVNVIDLDNLQMPAPEMVRDLPAGGRRLIQRAEGYVATIKSGAVVREHDESTGERTGRLLRGPQPDPGR